MSATSARRPTSLRARLAWSALALYVVLVLIGLRLQAAVATFVPADVWSFFALFWAGLIGALIVRRIPGHPIGWLFIAVGLSFALGFVAHFYAVHALVFDPRGLPAGDVAAWLAFWVTYPGTAAIALFVPLLFPDGHLPSPRWRPVAWLSVILLALAVLTGMFAPDHFSEYPTIRNPIGVGALAGILGVWNSTSEVALVALILLSAVALLQRLRRAGPVEQLQIRWFAYAIAILVVAFLAEVATGIMPALRPIAEFIALIAITALPTAAGIAILRYRLYDIDVIINRTVVYVSLTAILAGLYATALAILERVIVALTGQTSDVAVILTLFALTTVFTPIKNTLQAAADKYVRPVAKGAPMSTAIDDLVRLAELHARGILTDDEFAAKKKQLLGI